LQFVLESGITGELPKQLEDFRTDHKNCAANVLTIHKLYKEATTISSLAGRVILLPIAGDRWHVRASAWGNSDAKPLSLAAIY